MSTLKVEVVRIDSVVPHPNADRLDLATIKGWQVVIQKESLKAGALCVYFPIDSILPQELETKIFGADSKIKLTKSRIKTIKLRGAISQGMIATFETLGIKPRVEGYDLTDLLGVTKYEPPAPEFQAVVGKRSVWQSNPHFRKYTAIENIKNFNTLFAPDDEVIITEKIHGTNFRAGWVLFDANTLWKKVKKWLGLASKYEFVFGSHNVQLQDRLIQKGWHGNLYANTAVTLGLKEKLLEGEVLYGEVYGPGIQKGYHYGKGDGETGFVAFDLMKNGQWLDHHVMKAICQSRNIPVVPTLFEGIYEHANLNALIDSDSHFCKSQKVMEGVVVRAKEETHTYMGRKVLKCINPEYLLKEPTEWH